MSVLEVKAHDHRPPQTLSQIEGSTRRNDSSVGVNLYFTNLFGCFIQHLDWAVSFREPEVYNYFVNLDGIPCC